MALQLRDVVRLARTSVSWPVAAVLLGVIAALVAWHLNSWFAQPTPAAADQWLYGNAWSLEADRRVPELFCYGMQMVTGAFLLVLCCAERRAVYLAWAAVFGVVLIDDSFQLHENISATTLAAFDAPAEVAGIGASDLGELVTWALLAAIPLAAVVVLHRRSDPATRTVSWLVGLLTLLYVGFGVGVDLLHSFIEPAGLAVVVGVIEDGGELVALSFLVAVLTGLTSQRLPAAWAPPNRRGVPAAPGKSSMVFPAVPSVTDEDVPAPTAQHRGT